MNRHLLFEFEHGRHTARAKHPPLELVTSYLQQLSPKRRRSFCILSDETGSYVQCAGTSRRMIIEHRKVSGDRFTHVVLGLDMKDTGETTVRYSGGPIRLKQNGMLNAEHSIEVFTSFYETGKIPARYILRDNTLDFADLP